MLAPIALGCLGLLALGLWLLRQARHHPAPLTFVEFLDLPLTAGEGGDLHNHEYGVTVAIIDGQRHYGIDGRPEAYGSAEEAYAALCVRCGWLPQ